MSKRESFYLPARELRVQTDSATDFRTIVGQIPYDSPSVGLPWVETISRGAFSEALKPGADCCLLRDHDFGQLLGRVSSGTLQLQDSDAGLTFRCTLPKVSYASDLIELMERGDTGGVSMGFYCRTDSWDDDGKGQLTRALLSVELLEITIVSGYAAYPAAEASLRSVPHKFRSLIKLSKRTNSEGCDCPCEACADEDDCESCTNDECDYDCPGCPNQDGENRTRPLTWAERTQLRIEVLKHR